MHLPYFVFTYSQHFSFLFFLLIAAVTFSCEEEDPVEEEYQAFSEAPYFEGTIMDVALNTRNIQEDFSFGGNRRIEEIPDNDKSHLILSSNFSYHTETSCGPNCISRDFIMYFYLEYKDPFVDQVFPPTSAYLAEGVKTFHRGGQAGFNFSVSSGDTLSDLFPSSFNAYTKAGDQSESSIEVVRLSKKYNTEIEKMEYEVLLEVDANLYDSEGAFMGKIQGEFLTRFEE
ncbi:hypothetical protein WJR50_20085 [Catalinimonas sp. 4WD22]|uniref:hypothetical protein n=1 Tax=Catalinimonas locisalis TaxID=3133978 RepID=UPI0031018905